MKECTELIDYVKKWQAIDGLKPCNEMEFYYEFIKLIKDYPDDREVEFNGEGAYFGKQVTLRPYSYFTRAPSELEFEVAYSRDKISIYTANHNGFWNPEYLSMDKSMSEFYTLEAIFRNFLTRVFGL